MSESDSFIAEVTEDVRRDRLFALFRRYGWIAAVVIVALVAGTAYSEWSKSQAAAAAQQRGDAVLDALSATDEKARLSALAELASKEDASVAEMLLAASADNPDAAQILQRIADDADQPAYIADLARLKLTMLPDALPADEAAQILTQMSQPGELYRTPATELLVAVELQRDNKDAAIALMQARINDAETPSAQIQRFVEQLVALGATPELANQSGTDSQN